MTDRKSAGKEERGGGDSRKKSAVEWGDLSFQVHLHFSAAGPEWPQAKVRFLLYTIQDLCDLISWCQQHQWWQMSVPPVSQSVLAVKQRTDVQVRKHTGVKPSCSSQDLAVRRGLRGSSLHTTQNPGQKKSLSFVLWSPVLILRFFILYAVAMEMKTITGLNSREFKTLCICSCHQNLPAQLLTPIKPDTI